MQETHFGEQIQNSLTTGKGEGRKSNAGRVSRCTELGIIARNSPTHYNSMVKHFYSCSNTDNSYQELRMQQTQQKEKKKVSFTVQISNSVTRYRPCKYQTCFSFFCWWGPELNVRGVKLHKQNFTKQWDQKPQTYKKNDAFLSPR